MTILEIYLDYDLITLVVTILSSLAYFYAFVIEPFMEDLNYTLSRGMGEIDPLE
jgi:hypothetical protein